jgi:hypothetical protein
MIPRRFVHLYVLLSPGQIRCPRVEPSCSAALAPVHIAAESLPVSVELLDHQLTPSPHIHQLNHLDTSKTFSSLERAGLSSKTASQPIPASAGIRACDLRLCHGGLRRQLRLGRGAGQPRDAVQPHVRQLLLPIAAKAHRPVHLRPSATATATAASAVVNAAAASTGPNVTASCTSVDPGSL